MHLRQLLLKTSRRCSCAAVGAQDSAAPYKSVGTTMDVCGLRVCMLLVVVVGWFGVWTGLGRVLLALLSPHYPCYRRRKSRRRVGVMVV